MDRISIDRIVYLVYHIIRNRFVRDLAERRSIKESMDTPFPSIISLL